MILGLSRDTFLNYVATTSEPLHIDINFDEPMVRKYMDQFWNALDKNTKSTELVFGLGSESGWIRFDNFIENCKIPPAINTLKLPCMMLASVKYLLPHHIIHFEIEQVSDIFCVDFSKNINLQELTINYDINQRERYDTMLGIYDDDDDDTPVHLINDLSHMYHLRICFRTNRAVHKLNGTDKHEDKLRKLIRNVKLPYN